MKSSFSFFAVVLLSSLTMAAYGPSVRTDRTDDLLLLRLSLGTGIPLPASYYCRPMKADEILRFVDMCDSAAAGAHFSATRADRLQEDRLRRRLTGDRHLVELKASGRDSRTIVGLNLTGDVKAGYDDSLNEYARGVINPTFSGCFRNFSFYTDVSVWTEYDSDTTYSASSYQPYNGNPYNLYGHGKTSSIRSSDFFRGGVSLDLGRLAFEAAVDRLRSGPADRYALTLSDEAAPVLYGRMRMDLGSLQYTHTAGSLKMQKDEPKYFYHHRLQFPLFKDRFVFGINEVIINGSTAAKAQADSLRPQYYGEERDLELIYLIPFVPFTFSQHYLGDRDNAVISFDGDLRISKNLRAYGEFFLDDMLSPVKLFKDDWGNKWAVDLGVQWFGELADHRMTVSAEYARIRPWTMTHFYGGSHSYSHYGRPLGFQLGPDADVITVSADAEITAKVALGAYGTHTRKGTGRGSSILQVYHDSASADPGISDDPTPGFFENGYTGLTVGGLTCAVTPVEWFNVVADLSIDDQKRPGLRLTGGFRF